jgi:Ca-activated chloride channel family protein
VFLVDVSGSMEDEDKLPLVKASLKLLARQLTAKDRISLVVYAGNTGVVLEPTPGSERATIDAALERLEARGSTNGGAGIALAYAMAAQAFIPGGNNRVLLATDGDFNVGTVNFEALIDLVEEKRKGGVALTTLGFGTGNYNDHLMERLADAGNGNHAYIDSLTEAERVLVAQRDATLRTIAKDVKIQVEFNPARVSEYRLIGYENRLLRREDFNNDQVDAGEIGAGHAVTALYEIALKGEGGERVEPLRYGRDPVGAAVGEEIAFVKLRYKRPEDGMTAASLLIEQPVRAGAVRGDASAATPQFRLAAAVAAYGQLLRGGAYTGRFGYGDVVALAKTAVGVDPESSGFLKLVRVADGLTTSGAQPVAQVEE